MTSGLYWHDISPTNIALRNERGYTLASLMLVWGEWIASTRGSVIGRYATEEEAKAVALVTVRMNQPNETEVFVEASRRRGVYISTPRRP